MQLNMLKEGIRDFILCMNSEMVLDDLKVLTELQTVTGKLPFAAVVLKKVVLLLQRILVWINDDRWTHLVVGWLLK